MSNNKLVQRIETKIEEYRETLNDDLYESEREAHIETKATIEGLQLALQIIEETP